MGAGGLRWGTEKRLEFINLRLFWDGVVNRQELAGKFGISLQQTSADFAHHLETASGNAAYNRAANGCVRSYIFNPRLTNLDAAHHFVLARISAPGETRPTAIDPAADEAQHHRVHLIIEPHPRLDEGQRKAIEADYGMTDSMSVIDVRASILRRFGTEGDIAAKPPQDQHVILLNRDDVMATRALRQEA